MTTRARTVRGRLFFSYSVFIIAVILIGMLAFFGVLFTEVDKRMVEHNHVLASSLANQLDTEVQRMDDIAKRIIFSADIRDLFATQFAPQQREERYGNQLKISERVVNVIGPVYRVARVVLASPDKRHLVINGYASIAERSLTGPEIEWHDQLGSFASRRLLIPPHPTQAATDKGEVFSVVRELAMPFGYEGKGYVEIQQSLDVLAGIVSAGRAANASEADGFLPQAFIFDALDRLVYPIQDADEAQVARYRAVAREMGEGVRPGGLRAESVCCAVAGNAQWKVLLVDDRHYIDRAIGLYATGIAVAVPLAILLALLLSYLIARRITEPIRQVHRHIQSMNPVTLATSAPSLREGSGGHYNEIEELDITFESLCVALRQSIDETLRTQAYLLQAKLLALQSQMNPHFLYNTLSAIGIVAEEERAPGVEQMIRALCNMLQNVSSDSTKLVPLGAEIEHTQNFLDLLKVRYEDAVEAHIDIAQDMQQIPIPKLVIQPLVENWSKYGMSDGDRHILEVRGERGPDWWRVCVQDNGQGFSEELLARFEAQKRDMELDEGIPDLRINGMGLINIYVRLRYASGEDSVFMLENTPRGGKVTVGGTINARDMQNSHAGR